MAYPLRILNLKMSSNYLMTMIDLEWIKWYAEHNYVPESIQPNDFRMAWE